MGVDRAYNKHKLSEYEISFRAQERIHYHVGNSDVYFRR